RGFGAGDDVAILVRVGGKGFVLLRGLLPTPPPGGRVRQHECRQRAVDKAQADGRTVLDLVSTHRVRRDRLHGGDLAAQRTQVSDFVNEVDQDRAAARLAAPGCVVEVTVRLVV